MTHCRTAHPKVNGKSGSLASRYGSSRRDGESGRRYSLHALGLLGVLEFLDTEHRPPAYTLGIQPARTDLSLDLSPQVAALARIVDAARKIIADLRRLE
ncbi:MAG: hypothetical protein JW955_03975 [Sedimentisphaerales bacterium]|nr:hypothetical protein [Sedimentisphaerales bacterium]